jgi:hypothetical protein
MVVIKKSKDKDYAFFIGMNREEKYSNSWDNINNYWKDTPDVFGYKDNLSGGTWFAYNNNILAILINKESNGYEHLQSRAYIVLQSLRRADSLRKAIDNVENADMSKYRPFNFLLIDREKVLWTTNLNNNGIKKHLSFQVLDEELTMLNRSFPNDMSEKRIVSNFDKFKNTEEPNPIKNDWQEWEQLLTAECFAEEPSQETCLWLNSTEWGTLTSDIIVLPKDKNQMPVIHHVKERRLN